MKKDITSRPISEVLENNEECIKHGTGLSLCDTEVFEMYYKLRNEIPLTEREKEINKALIEKDRENRKRMMREINFRNQV